MYRVYINYRDVEYDILRGEMRQIFIPPGRRFTRDPHYMCWVEIWKEMFFTTYSCSPKTTRRTSCK